MIVDSLATLSIVLHESLIPTLVVESLSMTKIVVVCSTQPVDTKMSIMENIYVVPLVVATEQIVTLASPNGGLYVNGQEFYKVIYSLKESDYYINKVLGFPNLVSESPPV